MTIYEIDEAIRNLVNEDGEIEDFEAFEQLHMEREKKAENIGLLIKEKKALAADIGDEIATLRERKAREERDVARLETYLGFVTGGEKLKTARISVSWRTSEAVEITPECEEWCREHGEYLREKPPEIDKAAIKNALKQGAHVEGALLVKRQNIQIK